MQEVQRSGGDMADVGQLLHSFLKRFGSAFRTNALLVSTRHGGVVPKSSPAVLRDALMVEPGRLHDHGDRFCVIDPLTGE